MTTMQSGHQALGLMAINYFGQIVQVLPEVMLSADGPRKVYPLILGLDALLVSYRKDMSFFEYDENAKGKVKVIGYYEKMNNLKTRKSMIRFTHAQDLENWMEWISEYLQLLSSSFNVIGLGPPRDGEPIDDDVNLEPASSGQRADSVEAYADSGASYGSGTPEAR